MKIKSLKVKFISIVAMLFLITSVVGAWVSYQITVSALEGMMEKSKEALEIERESKENLLLSNLKLKGENLAGFLA